MYSLVQKLLVFTCTKTCGHTLNFWLCRKRAVSILKHVTGKKNLFIVNLKLRPYQWDPGKENREIRGKNHQLLFFQREKNKQKNHLHAKHITIAVTHHPSQRTNLELQYVRVVGEKMFQKENLQGDNYFFPGCLKIKLICFRNGVFSGVLLTNKLWIFRKRNKKKYFFQIVKNNIIRSHDRCTMYLYYLKKKSRMQCRHPYWTKKLYYRSTMLYIYFYIYIYRYHIYKQQLIIMQRKGLYI